MPIFLDQPYQAYIGACVLLKLPLFFFTLRPLRATALMSGARDQRVVPLQLGLFEPAGSAVALFGFYTLL